MTDAAPFLTANFWKETQTIPQAMVPVKHSSLFWSLTLRICFVFRHGKAGRLP